MTDVDARACFPRHNPDSYHPAYDFTPPSVEWIVVPEPLVCPACKGVGAIKLKSGWWPGPSTVRCTGCNGTGLPDVQIVSPCELCQGTGGAAHNDDYDDVEVDGEFPLLGCGDCDGEGVTIHGVVPITAAVPIVSVLEPVTDENCDTEEIVVGVDGRFWFKGNDISDQFGEQEFKSGMWAHEVVET
jgi:DnaJ-class molecular chaperone